jgi:hypothetical protein
MSFFKSILFVSLFYSFAAEASQDPTFALLNIQDQGSTTVQNLVFMSERDLKAKIPEDMQVFIDMPRTQHKIVDPMKFYRFGKESTEQVFYPCATDKYVVVEAKNFAAMPYLVALSLSECVGVSIYFPKLKAGVLHLGFKGYDKNFLAEFLGHFPKRNRHKAKVTLLSSYCSILFKQVYDAVRKEGFNVSSVDVLPLYMEHPNRNSDGTKYYSYERLGIAPDDAAELNNLPQQHLRLQCEARTSLYPVASEYPRALVLELASGDSCQFFETGFYGANDELFWQMFEIYNELQAKVAVVQHREVMKARVNSFVQERCELNMRVAMLAFDVLGPEMEGIDRIVELAAQEQAKKLANK